MRELQMILNINLETATFEYIPLYVFIAATIIKMYILRNSVDNPELMLFQTPAATRLLQSPPQKIHLNNIIKGTTEKWMKTKEIRVTGVTTTGSIVTLDNSRIMIVFRGCLVSHKMALGRTGSGSHVLPPHSCSRYIRYPRFNPFELRYFSAVDFGYFSIKGRDFVKEK